MPGHRSRAQGGYPGDGRHLGVQYPGGTGSAASRTSGRSSRGNTSPIYRTEISMTCPRIQVRSGQEPAFVPCWLSSMWVARELTLAKAFRATSALATGAEKFFSIATESSSASIESSPNPSGEKRGVSSPISSGVTFSIRLSTRTCLIRVLRSDSDIGKGEWISLT